MVGEELGDVVALGTGNTCVTGDALSLNGRVMNDSHAEVVARRSLLKSDIISYDMAFPSAMSAAFVSFNCLLVTGISTEK